MPRVCIFGAGSIGAIYAYILQRGGASVTCICRSAYTHVAEHGYHINSDAFGHDIGFRPDAVFSSVPDAAAGAPRYDFVVVASKAFPGASPSTPSLIAPLVSPGTAIVLFQNGIGIEDEYASAFPSSVVLSVVIYAPVVESSPGVFSHGDLERLEIGTYPPSPTASSPALSSFVELVRAGGATIVPYEDVQPRRWSKLVLNAAWNPTLALARQTDLDFLRSSEYAEEFVWAVMLEVIAVAQSLGYKEVTEQEAGTQLGRLKSKKIGRGPSMLADVLGDRPMEVEAIVGNAVKLAKEQEVKTPNLVALYVLLKSLDTGMRERRSSGA